MLRWTHWLLLLLLLLLEDSYLHWRRWSCLRERFVEWINEILDLWTHRLFKGELREVQFKICQRGYKVTVRRHSLTVHHLSHSRSFICLWLSCSCCTTAPLKYFVPNWKCCCCFCRDLLHTRNQRTSVDLFQAKHHLNRVMGVYQLTRSKKCLVYRKVSMVASSRRWRWMW